MSVRDNIWAPGPPPSAAMTNPTPHNFSCGGGYLANWCCRCQIEDYPTDSVRTDYCEDREWGKAQFSFLEEEKRLKASRQHEATEAAIARARTFLTVEEWELLGIKVAPYRDIDRIIL